MPSIRRWLKSNHLTSATTENNFSIVCEMSTNSSKMHLGGILVYSAVRRKCGKSEKMLLQSCKVMDRAENGTSSFSWQGLSLSHRGIESAQRGLKETKIKNLPFLEKTTFSISSKLCHAEISLTHTGIVLYIGAFRPVMIVFLYIYHTDWPQHVTLPSPPVVTRPPSLWPLWIFTSLLGSRLSLLTLWKLRPLISCQPMVHSCLLHAFWRFRLRTPERRQFCHESRTNPYKGNCKVCMYTHYV